MQKLIVALSAYWMMGCSPLIGAMVRGFEGGAAVIHVGETLSGATSNSEDTYSASCVDSDAADEAYAFVPLHTGDFRFDVRGEYDCAVAVFDESGESVGCNDDFEGQNHSRLETHLEASHRYMIVVTGYGGATGSFTLSVQDAPAHSETSPANGAAADASPSENDIVPAGPIGSRELLLDQLREGHTLLGTDTHTPACGSRQGSPDEVWRFAAPAGGLYHVLVESRFDSTLAVYLGGTPTQIACNDDHQSARESRVDIELEAGQLYDVVVDGYAGQHGAYTIVVTTNPSPSPSSGPGPGPGPSPSPGPNPSPSPSPGPGPNPSPNPSPSPSPP